ncbi:MAG TPA: YceI family protein [Gemmatimonadota bacterium]|nr:YceI family protein [Gemmatimonadota bacterium]
MKPLQIFPIPAALLAMAMAGMAAPGASTSGPPRRLPPHPAPLPPRRTSGGTDTTSWRVLPSSTFEVRTKASGFLAALSHEHRVAATAFRASLAYVPGDPSSDRIDVTVPVDSLEVRTADASPAQLRAIRKHMMEDVLRPDRHPEMRFVSKSVTPTGDGVRVEGELTLADSTRTVRVEADLEVHGDTLEAAGTLPLRQTDYGIEPYSFGFGAIKVADRLDLRFDVRAVRTEAGSGGK